jgi:uroporphyrinogen-III synthase
MDISRRVWVTRDEGPTGPLSRALASRGLQPVNEPVMVRRVVGEPIAWLPSLRPADWLVLTSPFAIDALTGFQVPCQVAVVGEASRAAAEARGLRIGLVGADGTGEGLWHRLRQAVSSGVILYPRSERAEVPAPWAEVRIEAPVLYTTSARDFDRSVAGRVAVAALASASAADAMRALAPRPRLATNGRSTTRVLVRLGLEPWLESPAPTLDALAAAIADGIAQPRSESGSSRHHRA